jgi:hypothetical protein
MRSRGNVRRGLVLGAVAGLGGLLYGCRFWQVATIVVVAGVSAWLGAAWAEAGGMDVGSGGN